MRMLGVVSLVLLASGCESQERRPKGPNPYRRDVGADGRTATAPAATITPPDRPAESTLPCTMPAMQLGPGTIGSPVLFVNKDVLTVNDILAPLREQLERDAARLPPEEYFGKLVRTVRREIDRQACLTVIYQEAHKTLTEEQDKEILKHADEEIQQIVNLEFGGRHAKFEQQLRERGLTVAEFREKTRRDLLVRSFLASRFQALTEHPSRTELKKYYDEHADTFFFPARARMSLIQVRFDTMHDRTRTRTQAKEAARQKIERAREELVSGVPFEAVARAYSDDFRAAEGGRWDEFALGSLRARYEAVCDALRTMRPGQVSPVVEGSDAWFIIRCDAITPERRKTFEEAQPDIAKRILDEKYAEMQEAYVRERMARAVIANEQEFFQAVMLAAPRPPVRTSLSNRPAIR